jgi:hypothetical protein
LHVKEILGRTNRVLFFDITRTAWKTTYPPILRFRGKDKRYTADPPTKSSFSQERLYLVVNLVRIRDTQTHRHARPASLLLLRVFVAAGTCLSSRCLATIGRIHFTKALPINDRRDTHTDTDCWERFIKYATERGSGAVMYLQTKLLKNWYGH